MAHIDWIKEYSVGVEAIDEQHRYFLGLLAELFEAIASLETEAKTGDVLGRLTAHATVHFATEEKYFDEFGYEDAEDHKRRHRDMLAQMVEFRRLFSDGETNVAVAMVEFLEGWVIEHIMEVDKKYVKCFAEHGLR